MNRKRVKKINEKNKRATNGNGGEDHGDSEILKNKGEKGKLK